MGEHEGWEHMARALSSVQRRRILVSLFLRSPDDEQLSLPEDVDVGDQNWADVNLDYYHHHLPLLDNYGYIEWDEAANQVGKGPNWDEVEPLVALVHDHHEDLPDGWI